MKILKQSEDHKIDIDVDIWNELSLLFKKHN